MDYPELRSEHVRDARLFANRYDMIRGLHLPLSPSVCEVGVGLGDFSKFLIDTLQPSRFAAIDWFRVHEDEKVWGRTSEEVFQGKTHSEFYRDRFKGWPVEIAEGYSAASLSSLSGDFDLIYLDAGHHYNEVKADAAAALDKIKHSGTIIFNDFILYDHLKNDAYGVVPVVHEIVNNTDWKIVAMSLEHSLFCDVALSR